MSPKRIPPPPHPKLRLFLTLKSESVVREYPDVFVSVKYLNNLLYENYHNQQIALTEIAKQNELQFLSLTLIL